MTQVTHESWVNGIKSWVFVNKRLKEARPLFGWGGAVSTDRFAASPPLLESRSSGRRDITRIRLRADRCCGYAVSGCSCCCGARCPSGNPILRNSHLRLPPSSYLTRAASTDSWRAIYQWISSSGCGLYSTMESTRRFLVSLFFYALIIPGERVEFSFVLKMMTRLRGLSSLSRILCHLLKTIEEV